MHELHGFLVVDKPAGMTSFDVVARVRHAAGGKVGHAGTLDPFATGVLVVCLGAATRLVEYVTAAEKHYHAEVRFGVETDTYDPTGEVVAERPVAFTRDQLEAALGDLRGEIEQRPPAFSAIQIDGQRLYDLARRGQPVELAPRRVTIHRLDLLAWEPPRAAINVICSKGTYVRSLAHDLGTALGCGAHLSALRRLASGRFALDRATSLDVAVAAIATGRGAELLVPFADGAAGLPRLDLNRDEVRRLVTGLPVEGRDEARGIAAGFASDGALAAIVEAREGRWWPGKVFVR